MLGITSTALLALALAAVPPAKPVDGNRLAYLDEVNPYYPHRDFPKLITPQWVGEEGVEAVVILGIDDMRGHEKWEAYLRPILERLKKIDGRAPVSIMTCQIDPKEPHLQKWLKEGLSLECHTIDHPCPLLGHFDLAGAKSTYDRCIDQMCAIPGNRPVAFRTPCCDSQNTVSPRFFAEIFNKTTPNGNVLTIDSSVFCLLTPNDPALPRELVLEKDGTDRFRKYLPADRTFVNYIEDYPYPYVICNLCWEFPCMVPSDWAAQHLHKPNNPKTVEDWKAALDAVVIKQGVFCLVFHPHNWIRPEQVIQLIDHAVAKHGKKVKFLTFKEAYKRLDAKLQHGRPLGPDVFMPGFRLLDVNNDGYQDVIRATIGMDGQGLLERKNVTQIWDPKAKDWQTIDFPVGLSVMLAHNHAELGCKFGVLQSDGYASVCINHSFGTFVKRHPSSGVWDLDGKQWIRGSTKGLIKDEEALIPYLCEGTVLRDINADGICELIVAPSKNRGKFNDKVADLHAVHAFDERKSAWTMLPFTTPAGVSFVAPKNEMGPGFPDAGLRLIDLDDDGDLDIVFSNQERYGIYLFEGMDKGWSRKVLEGERAKGQNEIPPFVRADGTHNGAWIANRHIYWQNEETGRSKDPAINDLIDRRSFNSLLRSVEPPPKSPEQSLKCMKPRPGFQVELVAAEPLVMDPVGFEWGPDGKLWVVEMADYPLGLDDKGKPGGRVKFLEDTDGDGKYDKATLFLDNIPFPTDVMPWRKGVLITAAPDVIYAEDTDGDGKADVRVSLYTGFTEGNQQHRVNGLRWGLDNWIYLPNGDSGGRVKSVKTGAVVDLGARDLRIRPDEGLLDLVSGRTQHGRCRDDWGNWFGANNATPGWHYALDDYYLRRNPHYAAPDPKSELTSNRHIYPISRPISHWEGYRPPPDGAPGVITSACGHCVYRDDLFGPGFEPGPSPVAEALARERDKAVKSALEDLKKMTLTVVDGDFPREVVGSQKLIFGEYRMPPRKGPSAREETKKERVGHRQGTLKAGTLEAPAQRKPLSFELPGWLKDLLDVESTRCPLDAPPPRRSSGADAKTSYERPSSAVDGELLALPDPNGMVPPLFGIDLLAADDAAGYGWTCNLFMSETVHNVVHRMIVSPNGSTFEARRAADEQRSEFLASSDSWFRPTTLKTGPDGALYVADMYRLVIEHPQWIDDKVEKKIFLRAGHDKGRIYRVYPVGKKPRPVPRLDNLDTAGLVAALDSPNGWQRDMVQQMLIWRADKAAVPLLAKMAVESKQPLARLHALCTLDGINALTPELVTKVLEDNHPGVRRQAVRLCEPLLRRANDKPKESPIHAKLADALLNCTLRDGPVVDMKLELQLAYTLGEWSDPQAGKALAEMALRVEGDPYLKAAIMSSAPRHVGALLKALLEKREPGGITPHELLTTAVALKEDGAVAELIEQIVRWDPLRFSAAERFGRLAAFLDALARRGMPLALYSQQASPRLRTALSEVGKVIAAARSVAVDADHPDSARQAAIALLARDPRERSQDGQTLLSLLSPRQPLPLQQSAIAGIGRLNDKATAAKLFAAWKAHSPAVRQAIIDELLSRATLIDVLLAQIQQRIVSPAELDAPRRARLLSHPDSEVRDKARKLLSGGEVTADRRAVIERYRPAALAVGDAARGLAIYKKLCANCHRLGDVGVAVGPDLKAMADRSPETMLTAVLDPNRAVESRYLSYSVLLADGRIVTGMLASESGSGIVLLAAEGKKLEIARADIEKVESSGKSLMPDGMEKDLSPRDLADVIAYLNQHGPPRRTFPGNEPHLIQPAADGSLHLTAAVCEIYGEKIVFEEKYKNLGYWSGPADHAVWRVELSQAGTYEVWLDYACQESTAGNSFVLQAGNQSLSGRVASTGDWDTYRRVRIGRLTLSPGKQSLAFRPSAPPKGVLIDLREIHLVPEAGKK
jgi:putative membrane-bound dehydrogenase-like protein